MIGADLESAFRAAIAAAGITPPERVEADGEIHRFPTNGKRGDDSGWYVLYGDGIPAGTFGCWRSGVSETWRADIGRKLTPAETAAHRNRVKALREARELEEQAWHAQARERAASIWKQSTPAGDHPYLLAKKVKAHGTHFYKGALVIPIRDLEGTLHSLEFISGEGEKKFLKGGKVAGNHYLIGTAGERIYIAEGFATGASVHEATGCGVAVAFNSGNLEPVARALKEKYPQARIVIAGDNDVHGSGQEKAAAAAQAVGGATVIPAQTGKDWNDIANRHGAEEARRRIEGAPPAAAQAQLPELTPAYFTPQELLNPIEPERYLIPGLAPVGAYALIAGALATYKTILEHTLLLSRASGIDLLGLIGPQYESLPNGPCMLLSYEDNDTHIRRRIQILAQFYHAHLLRLFGTARARDFLKAIHRNLARLTLTGGKNASLVAKIDGALQQNDAFVDRLAVAVKPDTLIAIDPLRLAIRGSQNDDDGADVAVVTLNGLANLHAGCGVMSTSHTTKAMAVTGAANSTAKAYGTSGSALYSQHARSNLHTGKLTGKEMREGFAPDTFTPEEIERGRAVCLTHARLSHAAEGHDRYFVMREGVLVPAMPAEGVDLKAGARRELTAIRDALARLRAAGHVASKNALEKELVKTLPRRTVRDLLTRGEENGWLTLQKGDKEGQAIVIDLTPEGRAYIDAVGGK